MINVKTHITSFLRAPIGYVANVLATIDQYVPVLPDAWLCAMCETFCARDGVQDTPLF